MRGILIFLALAFVLMTAWGFRENGPLVRDAELRSAPAETTAKTIPASQSYGY